jgi:hypothetical protein
MNSPVKALLFLMGIAIGLVCVGLFVKLPQIPDGGAFGSLISGTFGLVSSLGALFLLYNTYKTQREELDATKQQMVIQNSMIAQQKFETTFFNLLSIYRENAKKFGTLLLEIKAQVDNGIGLLNMYPSMPPDWNSVITKYSEVKNISNYRTHVDSYFRMLQYILDFIIKSNALMPEERETFYKLVETTMTEEELFITFFECRTRGFNDPLTKNVKQINLLTNYLQYRKHNIPTPLRDYFILNEK